MSKLVWAAFVMLVLSTAVTLLMGIFDWMIFVGVIILAFCYGIPYVVLVLMMRDKDEKKRKDMAFGLRIANRELQNFAGGVPLEWNRGIDRTAELKEYRKPSGEYVTFMALRAHTVGTAHGAVVIMNMDDEKIVTYNGSAGPEVLKNPWEGFDPFNDKARKMDFMGRRFGGKGRNRFTLNFGDDGSDDPEPDQDLVNRAVSGGEEIGPQGKDGKR